MKNIVILGAGTAGTMMANSLARKMDKNQWKISIVDEHSSHYYQPGFLFIPVGVYTEKDVIKKKKTFLPNSVEWIQESIDRIDPALNNVLLKNGSKIKYDILIVATGSKIVPDEVEGLAGDEWYKSIFDFYTIEGALGLHSALENFNGGQLVVHLKEMPIKCPVAPLEFVFLADWYLSKRGIREATEITYVTPLPGAFTKQNCSTVLGYLLNEKNIKMQPDFDLDHVDSGAKKLVSFDETTVNYDLLVEIPTNMGDAAIERSEIGDELNFIPTDKHTLQSKGHDNIFVIGDATDVPASKAGSVAHFQAETLTENIARYIAGKELEPGFDGHANCFIESGYGKAFLIDFNYDYEPVEGTFPIPGIGPFSLLKETRINHFGKLAFKWLYWNILLKAYPIPGISHHMTKAGKNLKQLDK